MERALIGLLYIYYTIIIGIRKGILQLFGEVFQNSCKSFGSKGLWLRLPAPGDVSRYAVRGYVRGKTRNPCTLDFTTCWLVTDTPSLM